MPRWGPCQCGHMGPPLMVMGTMVMVVENHFPAAFRHQLDVFIFRASVTAHSIKPICDQHKMQVGQCCVRARHLAINSYHLFWAKSFITNPLPHNSSAAEPQNTSTPHTHFTHLFMYLFIEVILTTGLSMMPLRKMRSRSLAVVELVLSLSVSRAWCMAIQTSKKGKREKTHKKRKQSLSHSTTVLPSTATHGKQTEQLTSKTKGAHIQ